jgi:hypothetical protein
MKRTIVNLFETEVDGQGRPRPSGINKLENWQELLAELKRAEFMAVPTPLSENEKLACIRCSHTLVRATKYTLVINNTEYRWTSMLRHSLEKHQGQHMLGFQPLQRMLKDVRNLFSVEEV